MTKCSFDQIENGWPSSGLAAHEWCDRECFGDNEDRVLEEELGEDRLQEFLAVDVFGFFGLAERDERHDGVKAVGWGVRGRVVEAENVFFGCRSGNFAFRHFRNPRSPSLPVQCGARSTAVAPFPSHNATGVD